MKKVIFLFVGLVFCLDLFSQNFMDVVYLKNGNILNGVVIEQVLGESIRFQTADGNIFTYQMIEVEKIHREFNSGGNSMSVTMNSDQQMNPVVELRKRPFFMEIFGAYSFSWLAGFNDATGYDGALKSSYQVGLGFTYAINRNFGIETGSSFLIPAGNEYSQQNDYGSTNGNIDLSYVQFPLLLRYDFMNAMNLPKGKSVGVKSGLQYGLNTSASDNGNTLIYSSINTAYYDTEFDVNNNIDWVFGFYGYSESSGISMNFNMGLNGVAKDVDERMNFKNRNITFSYSYRF